MADDSNMVSHVATYEGMIAVLKWASAAVAAIVLGVICWIAR